MLGVCLKYGQTNYGSKLQAFATVKMLEELGQNYEIIRYHKTPWFYLKSLPRFFNIVFLNDRYDQLQKKIAFKTHSDIKNKVAVRKDAIGKFDENFKNVLSEKYESYTVLKNKCKDRYDAVITCSDQLWSPAALGSGFYNLMFVPYEVKKISWASSFGVSKIPWYQKRATKRYLERIEYISTRENRGAQIVKELTDKDVPVLMDPVFAFDKEKWNEFIPCEKAEYDDYIFCYFLGSNLQHRQEVEKLAKRTGCKIITLPHLDRFVPQDEKFGDVALYDVTVEHFLNLLRNAKYICTDSFHGMAFSIIFEKHFIVFDRYKNTDTNSKNSRIETVCQNLDLGQRRFIDGMNLLELLNQNIDYIAVNEKVKFYQEKTRNYLKQAFGTK